MVRPWNHLSRANNVQMTRTGRMTIVETTAMMIASEDGRCMGGEWGATISRRVSFSRNSTPQERRKQEKSRTVESKAKEGNFSVVGLGGRRVGVVDGVRAGMCKFSPSLPSRFPRPRTRRPRRSSPSPTRTPRSRTCSPTSARRWTRRIRRIPSGSCSGSTVPSRTRFPSSRFAPTTSRSATCFRGLTTWRGPMHVLRLPGHRLVEGRRTGRTHGRATRSGAPLAHLLRRLSVHR